VLGIIGALLIVLARDGRQRLAKTLPDKALTPQTPRMIRLETERLLLRDHEPQDLEPFCEIESDPEYRQPRPVHPREELERSFLAMV
jgi:hypothetical protein